MTPRVTEVSYDKFLDMLSGGQVTVVAVSYTHLPASTAGGKFPFFHQK